MFFSPSVFCLSGGVSGNWIEIAYGTSSGAVRVIVQHPETVGSGPQLFQTFTVHRSPVTKIMLSEKHLVSGKEEWDYPTTHCPIYSRKNDKHIFLVLHFHICLCTDSCQVTKVVAAPLLVEKCYSRNKYFATWIIYKQTTFIYKLK